MERKEASDFSPQVLELFDGYYAFAQQSAKDDARIETEYLTYPSPHGPWNHTRIFRAARESRDGVLQRTSESLRRSLIACR